MKRFVYVCAYCHKPKKTPATKFFMCCGIAQPCKTAEKGVSYTRPRKHEQPAPAQAETLEVS